MGDWIVSLEIRGAGSGSLGVGLEEKKRKESERIQKKVNEMNRQVTELKGFMVVKLFLVATSGVLELCFASVSAGSHGG